jgi:cell division protein ZipA
MWELRWILAGLGAALLVALYLWGRRGFNAPSWWSARRLSSDAPPETSAGTKQVTPEDPVASPLGAAQPSPTPAQPERIVTVRLVPRKGSLRAERAVMALRSAGLRHGRYGIFHAPAAGPEAEPLFSVANLLEPGSFDLDNLRERSLPGMSFFLVLPGEGDPVSRFDAMVQAARLLAVELDGELLDERGSSWSIQRERYVREELIQYRHQLPRS